MPPIFCIAACVAATASLPSPPVPRAQRLHEFRQTIIALYRVPGAEALNVLEPDPLEQLRSSLKKTYGVVGSVR